MIWLEQTFCLVSTTKEANLRKWVNQTHLINSTKSLLSVYVVKFLLTPPKFGYSHIRPSKTFYQNLSTIARRLLHFKTILRCGYFEKDLRCFM